MVNKKKIGCLVLIIVIVLFISLISLYIFWVSSTDSFYIYETEDEVIELFQNNTDDFEQYVKKFYGHHLWKDYFADTKDNDFPNYKKFKKYITDEEYKYFEEFDQKYHPAFWSSNGCVFSTKEGNVEIIKAIGSNEPIEVKRAKSNGCQIQYFDNGWICIHYYLK